MACQSYAGLNLCPCILVGVFHEAHILFWNTLLSQTPPDFLSWDLVVRLLKVYNNHVQDTARGPGPARDPILSGPRDVPKL